MTYISSGSFRADVEEVLGQSLSPATSEEQDEDQDQDEDSLASFPAELRTELVALRELASRDFSPNLCALSWGDFCPVPALEDAERDEVLEEWFDGDEAATDFVMSAVDIVNGSGFYVVVDTDGRMGLLCEDPYGFDVLGCNLEQFLRALVAAHRAVCTRGIEAAKAELLKVVDERTAGLLLTFASRLEPNAR